jgi:hypothetical protein
MRILMLWLAIMSRVTSHNFHFISHVLVSTRYQCWLSLAQWIPNPVFLDKKIIATPFVNETRASWFSLCTITGRRSVTQLIFVTSRMLIGTCSDYNINWIARRWIWASPNFRMSLNLRNFNSRHVCCVKWEACT